MRWTWWEKAVPIRTRPTGPWAIGLLIRSSPFQRPCAGQTCATSPTLVSRAALAIPNPKTSPSQPQHHPGLIPNLGPPQPQLHALPQDRSPAQTFPYPKQISNLTPFPSPTPIPSPTSFYPQHSPTQTHPPPEHITNPIPQSIPTHLKPSLAPLPTTNSSPPISSCTAYVSVCVWLSFIRCITGL